MTTWIALLRGINVGGHRKLPMAELKKILTGLGCLDPQTYIQSGNAVFGADRDVGPELEDAIEARKGFRAAVLTLTRAQMAAAARANPFPDAVSEPKSLHLFFLSGKPKAGVEARLQQVRSPVESCVLKGKVLYLHTPELITGSKIAPAAERLLGVSATARNWRSVERILSLAGQAR